MTSLALSLYFFGGMGSVNKKNGRAKLLKESLILEIFSFYKISLNETKIRLIMYVPKCI